MRRTNALRALMCGLGCCAVGGPAQAETLFDFSGRVALADGLAPDGVKAKLQVDLDRNGKLENFETLSAKVQSDGSYTLAYELRPQDVDLKFLSFVSSVIAGYQARGFDSLLDDGPLPVALSFEREGYGTVVKRLNTLFESPSLDVTLAPLSDVQCADTACLSADGGVRLSEFPGGTKIARAYADAYDPSQETTRFPGLFTDRGNNLLVSSGFAEVNLYQADGTAVHQISSPVTTRFEAKRPSWSTLPDLDPNSGRIELPMYSFDQATGEWVSEADGELQFADGRVVPEDDLPAIHDGSYAQQVFVAFSTKHFSTFNCDAPIAERACVKGRIVARGTLDALAGISVSVNGVSYTGSAGTIITGVDGSFATDLRKSELPGEDLDRNGQSGELLEARVVATGTGVFTGEAFETPTEQASVGQASRPGCKPADCDCLDLGDIEVEFEEPRLCELSVEALFSGRNVVGSEPESGTTGIALAVVGDAPQIQLDASWSVDTEGTLHYYSGSLVVDGCGRDETTLTDVAALRLDHSAVTGLGEFITALGDAIKPVTSNPAKPNDRSKPFGPGGCGCQLPGRSEKAGSVALLGLSLLGFAGLARRRRRA